MAEMGRSASDDDVPSEKKRGRKRTTHQKRKPNIKEIAVVDADAGQGKLGCLLKKQGF